MEQDKRKIIELGWLQKEIDKQVSWELDAIFDKGFSEEVIRQFENYQERSLVNLKEREENLWLNTEM